MRRLICAVIALMLLAASISGGIAEKTDGQIHNSILIIDNSRCAADPNGLRFDAAEFLYENILSAARTSAGGKVGVVVFCGPNNCVSYGPTGFDEDPEFLYEEIGSRLSAEANRARRDNYTDFNTALEAVQRMMLDFSEGDTRLILLANSGNDLTDAPDPYNQPENLEANERTFQLVEEIHSQGASLQIIAFTAPKDALFTEAFRSFVARLAKAGGGKLRAGAYDNVLEVTQADLGVKLLQRFSPVEAAGGNAVHDAVERTPVDAPFTIPAEGVGATIDVAFLPSDRDGLESIALVSPDGTSTALYGAGGVHSQSDIAVIEDRNHIAWDIPSLQPGEWHVTAAGKSQAAIPIQIVIRLPQDPGQDAEPVGPTAEIEEAAAGAPDSSAKGGSSGTPDAGSSVPGTKGDDSDAPDAESSVPGTKGGDSDAPDAGSSEPGATKGGGSDAPDAGALESADIDDLSAGDVKKGVEQIAEIVREEGKVTIPGGSDDEDFSWQIEAVPDADQIRVSWQGDELTDTLAELREKGSNNLLLAGIRPEDAIELGLLEDDVEYVLLINAFSSDEENDGTGERIEIAALDLKLVPEGDLVEGTTLNVANAVLALTPVVMNSDADLQQLAQTAQAIQGDSASQGASGRSGASGADGGESTAPSGSGSAASGAQSAQSSGDISAPSEEKTGEAPADEPSGFSPAVIFSIVWSFLKNYWMYFAGAVGLVALVLAIAVTRSSKVERVSGNLRINCDELNLHQVFRFEGRGRIKTDSPLTQYPDIAKQKNSRIYTVMSTLRVDMVEADESGKVPDCDTQFKLSEKLIKVIYTDPRTNREQICYVSQYDTSESLLNIFVGGRTYDLGLSSNLSFDDLLYSKR